MGSGMSAFTILCFSIFLTLNLSSIGVVCSSSCRPQSAPFFYHLQRQCPSFISSPHPVQMDGEALERVLSSKPKNLYTAVLFYASWCPFSSSIRGTFGTLSSMFPLIEHIEVEQSSAMPSVFSRHGVHSLPALLIVNQAAMLRYHGKKDIQSLAHWYQKTTGVCPSKDLSHVNSSSALVNAQNQNSLKPWYQASSWKEMVAKEPYLLFSISFIILRIFAYIWPLMLSGLASFWSTCNRHFNLGVFGESRQLLAHAVQMIDVMRVWNKLKWCKTRNFHKGARNARVWASSLASVSLGETSSARSASTMLES